MSDAKDAPYHQLQKLYARHPLGCPEHDLFIEILKFYFSPEEAHIASHMTWELEPEETIALRAGLSLDDTALALTAMASRGYIRGLTRQDGVRVFRLLPLVPGLYEVPFTLQDPSPDLEKLAAMWDRYYREGWGHELHGGKVQISRVLPPKDMDKEQVLPYEDVVKVLEQQERLSVIPCACRSALGRCDHTLEICLALSGPNRLREVAGQLPVYDPAHALGRPRARPISVDEAIHLVAKAEGEGLVHVAMNVQNEPSYICACCRCCCALMRAVTELTIPFGVAPSSFWAVVEEDECNGCEACVDQCPVRAITIEDGVAQVNHDLCLGCGLCTHICPLESVHLERRDNNIFVPVADEREMYTIIGLHRNRPWPVHHHD